MKIIPFPVALATVSALVALPFSFEAATLLAITAGLGAIICVDYSQRYRGLRVPRLPAGQRARRPLLLAVEPNRLAA